MAEEFAFIKLPAVDAYVLARLRQLLEDPPDSIAEMIISDFGAVSPYRIPRDMLTVVKHPANLLGRGGYGAVYRAMYQGGAVAAKFVRVDLSDAHIRKLFMKEVELTWLTRQ